MSSAMGCLTAKAALVDATTRDEKMVHRVIITENDGSGMEGIEAMGSYCA